jgi:carbon-monoxide dehydrogenase iron sulfur subunit
MTAYVLNVEHERCTGCQSCTIACATKRERICNPLLGRIQIATLRSEGIHIPVVCRQCEDAPCQRVCPVDALPRDPATQVISIDYNRCIGCRYCVQACPFGAVFMNVATRKVMKCDQCDGDPMCVKVCHNQAIKYVPVTLAQHAKRMAGAAKIQELASTTVQGAGAY